MKLANSENQFFSATKAASMSVCLMGYLSLLIGVMLMGPSAFGDVWDSWDWDLEQRVLLVEVVPNIAENPDNPTPEEEEAIEEFNEQAEAAINDMNAAGTGWILVLVPPGNPGGPKPNVTISAGEPEDADWGYALPDETLSGDPVTEGATDVTHVTITVDTFAEEFFGEGAVKAIIMHELGHAMRADDLTEPGHVMTGTVSLDNPPCSTPSPTDIEQITDGCNSTVVKVDSGVNGQTDKKSAERGTVTEFVFEPLPGGAFNLAQASSLDVIPFRPTSLDIEITDIDVFRDQITALMAPNSIALHNEMFHVHVDYIGGESAVFDGKLIVTDVPPPADAFPHARLPSEVHGVVGEVLMVDGRDSYHDDPDQVLVYEWSSANGLMKSGDFGFFLFELPGQYTISVMVEDHWGRTDMQTTTCYVSAPAWTDLGNGLAGSYGTPVLEGFGSCLPNESVTWLCTNALESSTLVMIVGFSPCNLSFRGGVLVPALDFMLFLSTSDLGELEVTLDWPELPLATPLFFQCWIEDPDGPYGYSASNGLMGVTQD